MKTILAFTQFEFRSQVKTPLGKKTFFFPIHENIIISYNAHTILGGAVEVFFHITNKDICEKYLKGVTRVPL